MSDGSIPLTPIGTIHHSRFVVPRLGIDEPQTDLYFGDIDPERLWMLLAEVGLEPESSHPEIYCWDRDLTDAECQLVWRAVELAR
jgi:hypothetical protein